ncbi:hypothetical protein SLS53_003895 [Cytospora paraplurivora]|uniref:Peptidase S8/S53 domain-containing protein n=1 Tax=Cytospora paraplurivora TaxID=2898453 RepID=A0AAN9U920_9PEZI
MLDCEGNIFNNFVAQLPNKGASHNQRYEQPGLNLRGYKTALDVQYARGLRESQVGKDAGVLGIAYLGRVLLNPPSPQVSSGPKPLRQAQQGQNVGLGDLWHLEAVDASPSHSAGRGVNVYVMDTGINENHAEFQGRDFAESFVARDANGDIQDLRDPNGQGTAVASLIGGNNVGVAKGVNIIPVKHSLSDKTLGLLTVAKSSPMSLFESLQWILWHVIKSGKQGRAVVNVSQVVTSAGHDGQSTEGAAKTQSPRRLACPGAVAEKTLIVVGASQRSTSNAKKLEFWPKSNSFAIIDVLAPGKHITVARHNYNGVWRKDDGTSLSAAITSGIIAQYLGENDIHTLDPGSVAQVLKRELRRSVVFDDDTAKIHQVTHEGRSFPLLRTLYM